MSKQAMVVLSTAPDEATAAALAAVLVEARRPASKVLQVFQPLPQLLRNVRIGNTAPLEDSRVRSAIDAGEAALGGQGRLLIRKSGTEPVIRVMAEGEDEQLVGRVVEGIVDTIERVAG